MREISIYERKNVKYANDFNNLALKEFTAMERNIIMAVNTVLRDNNAQKIEVDCRKIAMMIDSKPNVIRVREGFESIRKKLRYLNYRMLNPERFLDFDGDVYMYSFWGKSRTDDNIWYIGLTDIMRYLLNDLGNNYTSFSLPEYVVLSKKYTKILYQRLKQFRNTGKYIVMLDKFIDEFDIPNNFSTSKIDQRVINPAIEELSPKYFENLKCRKIYDETSKKGRPRLKGYCFTFKKQTADEESNVICPICEEKLIYKMINGSWCWCHENGTKKNAKCSKIWNAMEEIRLARKEKRQKGEADAKLTEEQKDNKKRLEKMQAGLFKPSDYVSGKSQNIGNAK